jgi:multidrug efflux pump subunit AcrB
LLRRPYMFVVMAILIGIMGGLSIVTTPTDIFPYINIPMVGVIWTYSGGFRISDGDRRKALN